MIKQLPRSSETALGFLASGKLRHDEFEKDFLPFIAAGAARGDIGILVQFADDFVGWDLPALWNEIKYHTKYARSLKRMALVGDSNWQSWVAKLIKPFPFLEVRHFGSSDINAAWQWLRNPITARNDEANKADHRQ